MTEQPTTTTTEGSQQWAGFRPFRVPEALDGALSAMRREPAALFGLSALGVLPLASMLIALEYLGTTRRLFRISYDYDVLLYVAAALVPVLLAWKAVCDGALSQAALESLRRACLGRSKRRPLAPMGVGAMLARARGQWGHLALAGFTRVAVLWLPTLLLGVLIATVDPTMETWVRWTFFAVYASFGIPIVCLLSATTMMLLPKAAAGALGRTPVSGTFIRSLGLGFLMGLLTLLLVVNLHMAIALLLYLLDALFAADVSYWQRFFSIEHRLYVFALIAVAAVLAEPLVVIAPTFLWVDAMVRRDAVDLAGRLEALAEGGGRRVASAAVAENPSKAGDRQRVVPPAALLLMGAVAGLLTFAAGPGVALAQPQDPGQGGAQVQTDGGVTDAEVRRARQLLTEGESGSGYTDLYELQRYVRGQRETAETERERAFWSEVEGQVNTANESFGDNREREVAQLRARLDGPRLLDPGQVEDQGLTDGIRREDVDGALKDILSDKSFEELAAETVERDNPELDLGGRDIEERDNPFDCDRNEPPAANSGLDKPNLALPSSIFKVVAAVLLITVIGLVLFVLIRRFSERKVSQASAGGKPLPEVGDIAEQEPGQEDVLAFTFGDWQARAEQLARSGDFRLAIRCLYLALLVSLHRRGMIGYEPHNTNWEYEVELRRAVAAPGVDGERILSAFGDVTRQFELVWYGEREADAGRYGECQAGLEQIASARGFSAASGEEGSP